MRADGRRHDELRATTIEPGFIGQALGSALITAGKTRVICTASLEPQPPSWLREGGWVTAEYAMLPGATQPRGRRDPGGRGKEIQRLIGRSLRAALDLRRLCGPSGGLSLVVDCDVIQADGGTRTAAITGGYVALVTALRRLRAREVLLADPVVAAVAAVSVGQVTLPGAAAPTAVLDLPYLEDSQAAVDLNVVQLEGRGFVEVQGTGEHGVFSRGDLSAMLDLAELGCGRLFELQRRALEAAP